MIKDATLLTVDGTGTIHDPGAIYVEGGGEPTSVDRNAVIDSATRAATAAWGRFAAKYGGTMASN